MMGATKKQQVEAMFDGIAPTYDALNHALSFGIDKFWRRRVVRAVSAYSRRPQPPHGGRRADCSAKRILVLATGTGDVAIALARKIPDARITGVDLSEEMLKVGRKKISTDRITLRTGDAEALDFADATFDAVTVAFGVRNFGDIPRGLTEMHRVLRPGGLCVVLEFSVPTVPLFGWVFRVYFHRLLPWLGRLVSRDRNAYTYLPQSVDGFPPPESFAEMMRHAGFADVRVKKLTGGVATIFEAQK
jgi:demethylmenaquinone methyltransferase/2-methoxy-6-polyprenyl-1,4-benzoquinol methylase